MLPGTKVWLLIISNSGDWKSEQVNALNDGGITTRVIRSLSSRTLVSGDRFAPDLAPTLKDKIVLLPEMAQILTLHPNEKTAVWAQLRDLYDGYAGKDSGTGKSSSYSDLNVTLIGCSTPYIDMQVNLHQALGSRELIYRPPKEDETNENEIMKMALQNEHAETEMRRDLRYITQQFLHHRKYTPRNFDDDSLDLLKTLALFLTVMRAPAEWDTYTGELIGNAHPEKPTRVLKQLVRMYAALLSLDDEYEQHRAMSVLAEVIRSSAVPNRMAVYFHLMLNPNKEWTEYGISQEMKIGRKSVYRELNVLWNLGLVTRKIEESEKTFSGRTVESYKWSANHAHPIHSSLLKEYSSINNNIPIHIFKSENSQLFSKSETCACGELILKTDVAGMILKKCASCQPEVPLKREKRRAA
jgi:predicted transcriptional regulator